jgi:hypothetical protein
VFAKRKRSPFKGPMLTLGQHGGQHYQGSPAARRAEAASRSTSMQGRRSGEIVGIVEEEDEEEEEEDIEEVDEFSPVIGGEEVVDEGEVETKAGEQMPPTGEERGLGLVGEKDEGRGLLLGKLMEVEESPRDEKGKEKEQLEA